MALTEVPIHNDRKPPKPSGRKLGNGGIRTAKRRLPVVGMD
jgi:hypothetical protein